LALSKWLQQRIQRRHNRRRDLGRRGATDDGALERLYFNALPLRQIDQQRRTHRPRDPADVTADAIDDIGRHLNALRPCDPLDLAAAFQKLRADCGVGPQRSDRKAGRTRETGERHEENELLPDWYSAIVHALRLDVGAAQRGMNGANAR